MSTPPKPSFIRRRGVTLVVIAVLVISGGWMLSKLSKSKPGGIRKQEFSMVQVSLPPPPPPPPPPRPEPQPRDESPPDSNDMIAPDPVEADQPDAPADEAASDGNESMGTNIQSDGPPDGFGLVGRGSGGVIGGKGSGLGGSGNRRWNSYSGQAAAQIRSALSQHEKTRAARLSLPISIWLDSAGTIERIRLDASSGDADLDHAIETEIFSDFRLSAPPPADMPQPIRLRITAQRPG